MVSRETSGGERGRERETAGRVFCNTKGDCCDGWGDLVSVEEAK